MSTVHGGWVLIATLDELTEEITPVTAGGRSLMAVREGDTARIFDAACPHRGASLAHGGRRQGDCVVCPFHARRIRLGDDGRRPGVQEYPVLQAGEAVFTRLGRDPVDDRGFTEALSAIAANRVVVTAARAEVSCTPDLVVENAFDIDHFRAVHHVPRVDGDPTVFGDDGELAVVARFRTLLSPWVDTAVRDRARVAAAQQTGPVRHEYVSTFHARCYSPGLVVTEFGPPGRTHVVITSAVARPGGGAVARVAVGARPDMTTELPALASGARKALDEDVVVWDHLDPTVVPRLDARDRQVVAFRSWCNGFAPPATGRDTDPTLSVAG